jgi:hypothetical protein
MCLLTSSRSYLTYTQRADQGIADKNGVLISTTTQFDAMHALWLFDNGGEISSAEKPELVAIAKGRLVGLSEQQCERMDETALREQLESLVGFALSAPLVDTYLA